ncbi:hypothetical protein Cgig2_003113 [Carnegiea gigantea]|uniref:Uncharacterized protein n=1 Tax=Carnegiea gigantea TaxID=171969 RepID=A0A9Q1JP32_9CARY|nr:hypothetical protein Cgig2_003113 [Carnegiea gigantea]
MSTMTDTIMQQVSKQVKKAVEAATFARPLPHFDYIPTTGCEPSHRHIPRWSERGCLPRLKWPIAGREPRSVHWDKCPKEPSPDSGTAGKVNHRLNAVHDALPTNRLKHPYGGEGASNAKKATSDDLGTKATQCAKILQVSRATWAHDRRIRELRKSLHELEREPARLEPRDEECSTEIVATITGEYAEGKLSYGTHDGVRGGGEGMHFASLYNDPLVVEMKVANAIIQRILIDTRSSIDIITWDCLKKLKYPGREIVPLVHPILGFGGQEVNPTGMCVLIAFTIRSCSPTIKRRGLLITQVVFLSCRWNEIHHLRISSLDLGLTTMFHVLNVCLKVALLAENITSQDHQELPKELRTVLMVPPVALLLGLSRFLSARHSLGLCFRMGLF